MWTSSVSWFSSVVLVLLLVTNCSELRLLSVSAVKLYGTLSDWQCCSNRLCLRLWCEFVVKTVSQELVWSGCRFRCLWLQHGVQSVSVSTASSSPGRTSRTSVVVETVRRRPVLCSVLADCCVVTGWQVINGVWVSLPSAAPCWRPDVAVFKERLRILTVGGTRNNAGVSVMLVFLLQQWADLQEPQGICCPAGETNISCGLMSSCPSHFHRS